MTIEVTVIEDSVWKDSPRLTTLQLRYPRFIHAEFMTHRAFSRNASSSRAIPVKKLIEDIERDPVWPSYWGKNVPGMQAKEELTGFSLIAVKFLWRFAMKSTLFIAKIMNRFKVHKQILNRILEPFSHINVVVTATEWDNFLELRDHKDAQPEICLLAQLIRSALECSTPKEQKEHLPYVLEEEKDEYEYQTLANISAARCARVSYLTHEGKKPNFKQDFGLANKLLSIPIHASPFEHPAKFKSKTKWFANFKGWQSYRNQNNW